MMFSKDIEELVPHEEPSSHRKITSLHRGWGGRVDYDNMECDDFGSLYVWFGGCKIKYICGSHVRCAVDLGEISDFAGKHFVKRVYYLVVYNQLQDLKKGLKEIKISEGQETTLFYVPEIGVWTDDEDQYFLVQLPASNYVQHRALLTLDVKVLTDIIGFDPQ
jgi:hypothetical protein